MQFIERFDKIPTGAALEKAKRELKWDSDGEAVDAVFTDTFAATKKKTTFPLEKHAAAEALLQTSPIAKKWLDSRGISLKTAKDLHWGFVQDLSAVNPAHPWVKDGWISMPYLDGLTIKAVKFRSLVSKKDCKTQGILQAPDMDTVLYNLDAVSSFDDVFLCEGEPDCAVITEAGYNCVSYPSAGYTPASPERDALIRAPRRFLAGDMDTEGQKAMRKIWDDLPQGTYLIQWPAGCKDANDALLKHCKGDKAQFQILLEALKVEALGRPMDYMHDLRSSIQVMDKTNPMDNPARLRFPWANIDMWTPIVPGDVMALFATESKMGKTTWLMNILLHNAIYHGKVVINYSAELLHEQYARRAVAYLTNTDRGKLEAEHYAKARAILKDVRFYNGYKPKATYQDVIDLLGAAKKRLGADIIVIDHIHFLTRGTKDETQAVADAMRRLKDLAFDSNVVVIVVGQPRKMQQGRRQEATAQDAKYSEAFGSDSSQVFILHRERRGETAEGEAIFSSLTKVKLDYSRESETRVAFLNFEGGNCKFVPALTIPQQEEHDDERRDTPRTETGSDERGLRGETPRSGDLGFEVSGS